MLFKVMIESTLKSIMSRMSFDEDEPLYVSEDTHESSSGHDIDLKSSCIDVKDSAHCFVL